MQVTPKQYKIRKFQNGKNREGKPFINYSLTIPTPIAEQLPSDMTFSCELTEEGILFRPAGSSSGVVEMPSWASGQNGNGKKPRSRPRKAATKT